MVNYEVSGELARHTGIVIKVYSKQFKWHISVVHNGTNCAKDRLRKMHLFRLVKGGSNCNGPVPSGEL